jgi:hypothetical protein
MRWWDEVWKFTAFIYSPIKCDCTKEVVTKGNRKFHILQKLSEFVVQNLIAEQEKENLSIIESCAWLWRSKHFPSWMRATTLPPQCFWYWYLFLCCNAADLQRHFNHACVFPTLKKRIPKSMWGFVALYSTVLTSWWCRVQRFVRKKL